MSVFTPEAEKFLYDLQDQYIQYLKEEYEITSVAEYFEHVNAYENSDAPQSLKDYLQSNDDPLELLYQVAPATGQEVVLVSSNPGLPNSLSPDTFRPSRHHGRHSEAGDNVARSAEVLAQNLHGYLSNSKGFSQIIPKLQSSLDLLTSPDEVPFEEYIRVDESGLSPSLHDEIYYTRVYKLPSYNETALTKRDKEFGKQTFQTELKKVTDPKVVVCTGAIAWRAMYESVDNPQEEIEAYNESIVTDSFSKYDQGGARGGLYQFQEQGIWVLTTRHGSWPIDTERLEENLQTLNQHV
ncbi:hypothetical protein [Natronorubrum sp. A-ect3]|uniref:hypothetical protein n=1 Tax=Natronorubrum sp. A-ect3 TaxID=3242698 RepID=UPI00359D1424